ncbi:MAG: oxygenase MpaB family protein [Terracidiphilus sp.]|jgi:uncharacterized protein (DUF2236 family)
MASDDENMQSVTQQDSESLFTSVAARVTNPAAGIFGPASISWRINRESALFLGAGRAALLQLAHPWVTASLAEHSTVMNRPIERFHNTFRIVFTMIFGSLGQALAAARHLHALHTRIKGEIPEDVAQWKRGSRYQANEIGALRWVFATLVESAVLAYDCALPALSVAERDSYYAECKTLAGLFGLPVASLPENWAAFAAYNRAMHASDELGVSGSAQRMAHNLLSGAGSWIRPPFWFRAFTIEGLPERFRGEFDLRFGIRQQRAASRAHRLLPGIYRRLPASVRFTGPWREAQARLAHRPVDPLTRWSNRFWIGRPLLPFA